MSGRLGRPAALLVLVLSALPAAAYLLPAQAIVKRLLQKREELGLGSFEVRGTLSFLGEAATRAAEAGLPLVAGEATVPAFLTVKVPGRCRLEAVLADAAPAERPAATSRAGRAAGHRGLDQVPSAAALVQAVCLLLGERPTGLEPELRTLAALQALGLQPAEVTLARQGGRVAYVIGGKARDEKPLAWVDKQGFQPLRLSGPLGGTRQEVRLVDWGSPTGGDLFPRAVEVWAGGQLMLRFTTEKVVANPKVPDAIF